ncbi:hypothetical protein G15_1376 [Enterococcus avium]|nr:hypothetical protein G15_1376 [Enterococcus avium]
MIVDPSDMQFCYNPQLMEKLATDFMRVVSTDVPFFAVKDELLFLMNERDISKFRIPGHKTIDGLDHVFYFEVSINEDYPRPKLYKYLYQRIERREEK